MTEQDTRMIVDGDPECLSPAGAAAAPPTQPNSPAVASAGDLPRFWPPTLLRRLCPPLAWLERKWNERPAGARIWEIRTWLLLNMK